MELVGRQTSDGFDSGTSSTLSDPSSSSSSDVSTSQPTSFPPSSSDPTLPPTSTSEPTALPPSSDLTPLPPPSTSSSVPSTIFETKTPPPSSFIDSSAFPTATDNITTIITTVDGHATTFTSHLPTSLIDSPPKASTTNRTAVMAGTTTAVIVFLLIILAAVFACRKHRIRKDLAAYNQRKEGRGLRDGEDFDDEVLPRNMVSYRDREVLGSAASMPRPTSPTPSLLKSRTAETGSIFREELSSPPGFIDPISNRSSQVDLSRIVDEVMGPSDSHSSSILGSGHDQGIGSHSSSSYSGHHEREFTDATTMSGHSRFSSASANSSYPLLAPRNVRPPIPPISQYIDPFDGAPGILSASNTSLLPPGASPPMTPGTPSPQIPPTSHYPMHSTSSRLSPSTSSYRSISPSPEQNVFPPVRAKPDTQPKKSSPLARALTGDAKIWLGRSLHRDDRPGGHAAPTR
ncbi:hypothetical protein M413DRAFT_448282 [Hebeloma cylindrosporum]|uniref:Uncharacterized protein n=1 Tax=Hebeloma cylindrosporum TaxID=76867 RepID=A0A0C2XIX8_HEBCY|nr:hypothetical protein M413DRAFT_448282 [Hebeloma cylindrosporum h7]